MKESLGGVSLFNIVIVLVILFTGYISFSINYSKAYNVKNEIINIIKNQGGVCTSSISSKGNICYNFKEQITDYFKEANYQSTGDCKAKAKDEHEYEYEWIGYTRTGDRDYDGKNSAFCVRAIKANSNSELPNALYYQVKVFYNLDVPVIHSLFEFAIIGETGRIYSPNECQQDVSGYAWC